MEPLNSDWKLFRERLPQWQETHMTRLIDEYRTLLNNETMSSNELFCELIKRVRKDNKDILYRLSRSNMELNILSLLNNGIITLDDLDGFSPELIERIEYFYSL